MAKTAGSLAIGETVEIPIKTEYQSKLGQYIIVTVVANDTYCANSKLIWARDVIAYLAVDGKRPADSTSGVNTYGYNRYVDTDINQWIKSDQKTGWWKDQSIIGNKDTRPSAGYVTGNPYDNWAGFLYMIDSTILPLLGDCTVRVQSAQKDIVDTIKAKAFLPAESEITGSGQGNDGAYIAQMGAMKIAQDTAAAYNTATTKPSSRNRYWTRTISTTGKWDGLRYIGYNGTAGSDRPNNGTIGIRPLMALLNTAPISSVKNERGNYTISFNEAPTAPTGIVAPETCYSSRPLEISWGAATDPEGDQITYYLERSVNSASYTQVTSTAGLTYTESNVSKEWNTLQYRVRAYDGTDYSSYITSGTIAVVHNRPPVLSGEDGDLGEKSINVSYRYTVTDPDGDSVSITETVDSKTLRTYTARLGEENELDISGDNFTALSIGTHTITITAKDAAGNTTTRTLTFTKTITGFSVTLREPLPADTMPTRCFVNVSREIPFGALFQVEACNNPNDTSPVWEDITAAVLASHVHVFANDTDHGLQHGFNIRVTVERKSDLGECWIGGIGGNFE